MHVQPEPRFNKRIPCRVSGLGRACTGMVLNVSRTGMFVQTTAGVEPGDALRIELKTANGTPAIPIEAQVVWRRVVAPHLRALTRGGVGLRISGAPEPYYQLLADVARERPTVRLRSTDRPPAADPSLPRFRVRVKRQGQPRSRTLELRCSSEDEARSQALASVGDGWRVLELRRL